MNFIKDKYINMSIRKKLTYIYLPLTLIPLLIFAIIAYNTHQTTIIERSLIAAEENNWLLVSQVEDILEDAENCANMLAININNTIEKYERTQSEPKISLFNAINNELSYAMIIFSDINSIAYVDITETVHYTHPNLISNIDKVNEEDYRTTLEGSNGINTWFQLTQRDYLVIEQEEGVLTLGKKIIDIHDGKTLGYLYINIKDKTLKDVFNKQQSSSFFIFENGEALLATDDNHRIPVPVEESFYAYESRDSKVYNTDNEKMVVTTLPFKSLDWQLVSVTPLLD
ncbi:cache domain-containing protein [Vallitalea okinawensis]|uniref:cache domain-containing protein n=1 Tax=Vallitalea okinawensis TaxID=2078660 RepID=UPI000CFAF980|nr:cache domain-containing protein [Vallitalea okinawensis]